MPTSKDFLEYILEQLSELNGITYRRMMGEYIIYYRDKIVAYVCDNRFLVKPVSVAISMISNAKYEPPYPGAKDMILVEDIDDRVFLTSLIKAMDNELPEPKL